MILEYSYAMLCIAVAVRVMSYTRPLLSRFKFRYSLIAYIIIIATASDAVLTIMEPSKPNYLSGIALLSILLWVVCIHNGNVASLLRKHDDKR